MKTSWCWFSLVSLCCALFTTTELSMAAGEYQQISVADTSSLMGAIDKANRSGQTEIVLEKGVYPLQNRLVFKKDNIHLRSQSGNPTDVVLRGNGMSKQPNTEVLIDVQADHITISSITLERSGNHLIQVRAEADADYFLLTNSILRDSYEQMLKVSAGTERGGPYSDFGIVRQTIFEYTAGIGPQYYIGGIDAHKSKGWRVENNYFRDIASPANHVAEHAIHFWGDSTDTVVEGNTIVNCDRGIGFGLGNASRQHSGGLIRNNLIMHTVYSDPYSDAGIILESSPGTIVDNNMVFLYNKHRSSIEYRFPTTKDVVIKNNTTNKTILSRDGGHAELVNNRVIR